MKKLQLMFAVLHGNSASPSRKALAKLLFSASANSWTSVSSWAFRRWCFETSNRDSAVGQVNQNQGMENSCGHVTICWTGLLWSIQFFQPGQVEARACACPRWPYVAHLVALPCQDPVATTQLSAQSWTRFICLELRQLHSIRPQAAEDFQRLSTNRFKRLPELLNCCGIKKTWPRDVACKRIFHYQISSASCLGTGGCGILGYTEYASINPISLHMGFAHMDNSEILGGPCRQAFLRLPSLSQTFKLCINISYII